MDLTPVLRVYLLWRRRSGCLATVVVGLCLLGTAFSTSTGQIVATGSIGSGPVGRNVPSRGPLPAGSPAVRWAQASPVLGGLSHIAAPGTTFSQQAKLVASDSTAGDQFGLSVALSGTTALIGAPFRHNTGAAYVFVQNSTAWNQQAELTASNAVISDSFGVRVALSGGTALIGAEGKNSNAGAAYVFARSGTSWNQQAELIAHDATAGDAFGHAVALSLGGTYAVIGAPFRNNKAGVAYVFARSGPTWSQQAELIASDTIAGDFLGDSVAISGTTALVGAPSRNGTAGAVYVYVRSGTTWNQQAELTASDATAGDFFGVRVALSGSTALVGAYGKNNSRGAAYVFIRNGTKWSQQAELTASDASTLSFFGGSVALSLNGSTALIGAGGKSANAGAAYVFARSGTTWSQQAELSASDTVAGDFFGHSVALSLNGNTVLVGAYGKNNKAGVAYVFARSGTVGPVQYAQTD